MNAYGLYRVMHIETGVIVGYFSTEYKAEQWIENYRVTQEYKDRCYRIQTNFTNPHKLAS